MVRHVGCAPRPRARSRAASTACSRALRRTRRRRAAPASFEPREVVERGLGIQHRGERGRVGSDHDVLEQPALEPETGNAEVRVLIGELHVAHVVSRFGDAPGHGALLAVLDLARNHEPAGEIQQAAGGLPHHEQRHQVLEHGTGPRDEGGTAPHGRERPAEQEPVSGRDVALGDGHEASEPRLGGQQVVAARIERALRRCDSRSRRACAKGRRGSGSPCPGPSARRGARWRRAAARAATLRAPQGAGLRRSRARGSRRSPVRLVAQARTSERASGSASFASVRAMSSRFSAWVASSASRRAQPESDVGGSSRAASIPSAASRRCASVTVCARRGRSAPFAASSSRPSASRIPSRICGPKRGRCMRSRQACATAIRCPARLPLSTVET